MEPGRKLWLPAFLAREAGEEPSHGGAEPSLWEVESMLVLMFALHLLAVCRVTSFWEAADWLDNTSYIEIARTIGHGHAGEWVPQHFWGFPYAIALVSKLLAIRELTAIVVISMLASLTVCALVHRLYGGWVAAVFLFINYQWIELSVEGGSEPLFMCFLFAAFLAARADRWNLAASLAALGTTVRPVGVFALLSFAAVLAWRRHYRRLATITAIGSGMGILYVVPVWRLYGSPFVHFIQYRGDWGAHGWPLTFPFRTLLASYLQFVHMDTHWYTFANFAVCLSLALVGTIALWLPHAGQKPRRYESETVFASLYVLFLLSYNYLYIVGDFPRFLLPVVPILLYSLRDWIPRFHTLLWIGGVMSALLSAAARVGLDSLFPFGSP